MGWFWSLVRDAGQADSVGDWLRLVRDHQFTFAFMVLGVFGICWLVSRKESMGIRPKMKPVDAGMESGWQSPKEVKKTGLYE